MLLLYVLHTVRFYCFRVLDKLLQQRAKIKNALTEVIAFEDALGNITEKPLDSTNLVTYKISQLSTEFPFLDWTAFFHSAFKEVVDLTLLSPDTEVLIQVCFVQLFATKAHPIKLCKTGKIHSNCQKLGTFGNLIVLPF